MNPRAIKRRLVFRFLVMTAMSLSLFAQTATSQQNPPTFDKLVDFLPPAPNAAAITKYGDASVNKNSGTPNISIPLFSVKGTKLSTAISLGYSSNGIKVDEIASRVGMGWALNAGGVITRTLRGMPDETNNRHYPYASIGSNWATYNYMKRIAQSQSNWGYNNGFDAEPDLFNFSFDGYSGSFVFDGSGYVIVNKSGIKVETDFTANAPWNFKLITPDGSIYLFGGTGAIEKTKRTQTCGKSYTDYLPTAWYLKEIQHLNGEKIQFNYIAHTYSYDNGVTQTMYDPGLSGLGSGCTCTPIATSTCINISNTIGVLLNTIEIPGKALVTFSYTNRDDCNDKLIYKIVYSDPVNTIGSFDFVYSTVTSSAAYNNEYYSVQQDKTPYLASLIEHSADGLLHKTHHFSYIDPAGRPRRLSFSQDHWGYFNGKVNTSFVPNLGINYAQGFPNATANREPEFVYAQKGLLQKIVYPTGGTTTLFYESNVVDNGTPNTYTTLHKLSCDVTGTGAWDQQTKTKIFHSDIHQQIAVQIQCRDNSGNGNYDPTHNKGSVEIKDITANYIVFTEVYNPGFNGTINTYLPSPGHDYQLTLTANGTVVTTLATVNYYPNYNTSASSGNISGGLRVQKIATANPSETPMIKRYFYGTLENLNQSSMAYVAKPRYIGLFKQSVSNCNQGGSFVCDYNTLNSSSLFSLGYFNNGLVSYHSVVESIGENFEGGGTESKFYVGTDGLGEVMWNNDIINSPFTNFSSFYNAKPYIETVVKKMANGSLKAIKKTEYAYLNEPAGESTVYGYSVVEKVPNNNNAYDTTCNPVYDPAPASCYSNLTRGLDLYDMVRYSVFSSFVHPQSVTETLYDENGENPVVTVNNSFYENLQHYQLTRSEVTNSKGQLIRNTNKYPHDYSGTQVYSEMIAKNIITPLVNSKSEIVNSPGPNTVLAEQQIDYSNTGNFNYVPTTMKKSVKGNSLEVEGTIDYYDTKGNILQFTNKAGVTTSIIWGYDSQYPVAQVVGATYASAIAQLTGGSVSALQTMDGATLRTELHRIRTNLPSASVTSYTYKHLSGVSSITDPSNRTNTYEYDAFNRLIVVKDQDGNAVKKNEYLYATPNPSTGLTIYLNQGLTQTLTCTTCQPGFTGTSGSYTIPPGKHYSLISPGDAAAKEAADMATNGQEYVNKMAFCSNSASCTAPGYKFVSCGCELGQKICESTSPDPGNPGAYFAHFHYLWSDGSISPSFTEYITSCSGIDKKLINCVCETGVKICDNVTNNGGGSYTVTYHYHFSDNTNSASVTETISCSGPDKKMIGCNCETGVKIYTSSVWDKKGLLGCTPGYWLCTYHYHWSDLSNSPDYTECSPANCGPF